MIIETEQDRVIETDSRETDTETETEREAEQGAQCFLSRWGRAHVFSKF